MRSRLCNEEIVFYFNLTRRKVQKTSCRLEGDCLIFDFDYVKSSKVRNLIKPFRFSVTDYSFRERG